MTWVEQALCAEVDTGDHVWFPAQGSSAQLAQRICLLCPVRQQCLEYALADPSIDGVWGGTTPTMRRHLRSTAVA